MTTFMTGIFNDNFPPIMDGVALTAQNYAYWLKKKGEDVCVVTPYAPDSEEVIKAAPYPVYRYTSIPIPMRKPYRLGMPHIDRPFMHRLEQIPFDLVHAHCPFSSGRLALHIARQRNIPIVATFHSKYRQDFERAVHSKFIVDRAIDNIIRFYESVDEVWIPQAAVEPTIREYGYKGRVTVVDNGNDLCRPAEEIAAIRQATRSKLGIKAEETVFLFVGQHIWEKNIGFMLDALALVKSPFRLYMIGTGYAVAPIKEKIAHLGLSDKVSMLGMIQDRETMSTYYAAADLFLFPSLYDNAPLVVREAAAMHTPAILLKGSTASEIIEDGQNGFLSDNNTAAYANLVDQLAQHPEQIRQAGEKASGTIARPWENVVDEVIQRYEDIKRNYNRIAK